MRVVTGYLLGTPLFLMMDLLFDAPIRVAALQDTNTRFAYYGIAFGCGMICRARPRLAPWIGIGESGFSILLLILAIMLPIWDMADAALADQPLVNPFDTMYLANFVLSGAMLLIAFYGSQAMILTGNVPKKPTS